MAHHVYTTRGFVLGSRPVREADRFFFILTEDLGLVLATAGGIRKSTSKLGGILLDLAFVRVSLVRGKSAWRVTTAGLEKDIARELRARKDELVSLARVSSLIERMVRGEEKHQELFESFYNDVELLLAGNEVQSDVETWEILTVAHLLYHLGYLGEEHVPLNMEAAKKDKRMLIVLINNGIHESGLS